MCIVNSTLALILTLLGSVSFIAVIIILGWILIWKSFLSKFRLVRELLGHGDDQELYDQQVLKENNQGNSSQDKVLQEEFLHITSHKLRQD